MPKLRTYVYAKGEHGALRRYGPDDEVPSSVAKAITNPAAWADAGTSSSSGGDEVPAAPAPAEKPARQPRKTKAKPQEGTTQDEPAAEPADTRQE